MTTPDQLEKAIAELHLYCGAMFTGVAYNNALKVLSAAKEHLESLKKGGGDVKMRKIPTEPLTSPEQPTLSRGLLPCDHDECPPTHCIHQKGEVIETPRMSGDDRNYPLPQYLQLIQFEGSTCGVISPEEYEELYEKGCTLERALISAKRERVELKEVLETLTAGSRFLIQDQNELQQKLSAVEKERDDLIRERSIMSTQQEQFRKQFANVEQDRDSILGEYRKSMEQVRHTYKYLSMSNNHLTLIAAQELFNVINSETAKRISSEQPPTKEQNTDNQ